MKLKSYMLLIIFFVIFSFLPTIAYANSAEPPGLILILKNAPADVSVSIVSADSIQEGKKGRLLGKSTMLSTNRDIGNNNEILLRVSGNGVSYDQIVGKEFLTGYNSIVTLDFSSQTIAAGKMLSRSILLVTQRVLFTLVIEGVIFILFRFRDKKSWIAFLMMNLLTQGILNVALNGASPFASYLIFNLILMEFFVLFAELVGVLVFIKEHGRFRRVSYVLVANLASLVLGGYLITVLPI